MKYIYIHIPKCGGTSVISAMKHALPDKTILVRHTEKDVLKLTSGELKKCRVLAGHLSFGIHKSLPGEWRYITCFREPMERLQSYYRYKKETPTLGSRYDEETDNCLVRYMTGYLENIGIDERIEALENIENYFDLVMFLDELADGLAVLGSLLGVELEEWYENSSFPKEVFITKQMERDVFYDTQLYNLVK